MIAIDSLLTEFNRKFEIELFTYDEEFNYL